MPDLLRCPHCHQALARDGRTWVCAAGHRFDVARQGHVSLFAGAPAHAGDTAAMLDARTIVLGAGHLDVVTGAVVAALDVALPPGALVEVGAGTAHHLLRVRRELRDRPAVALDVSVAAARRAARADPEGLLVLRCDAWQPWPLLDDVAAVVLTIFGPRNPAEAARVLAPGGWFVVVTPVVDHLAELVEPLGLVGIEASKGERLRAEVGAHLDLVDTRVVRTRRLLDEAAVRAIALMGPSGHHLDPAVLDERIAALATPIEVTIAVEVTRWRART